MNRRQQLAWVVAGSSSVNQLLLDILGDDVGRPLVALVDAMAWQLDEADLLQDALDQTEPREYGVGEAIHIRQRQEP